MDKILKAADDIAAVFNVTQEWLEPGRSSVVKILKKLVEEKFTSTNTASVPCFTCGEAVYPMEPPVYCYECERKNEGY